MKARVLVSKVVRAAWFRYLASQPMPLYPGMSEYAQQDWDAESGRLFALADEVMQGASYYVDVDKVIRLINDKGRAGRDAMSHAREALRSVGGDSVTVLPFGLGWRERGSAHVEAS